eukprot:5704587-Alexandrium_andersonii.AAC.1
MDCEFPDATVGMDADMQPAGLAPAVPGPMTPTATPASSSAPSAASLTTGQDERVAKLEAD